MENLDDLYQWLHDKGIYLFERRLPFHGPDVKAVTMHLPDCGAWGIFLDRSKIKNAAEERSVLLHAGGHCLTGSTHPVNSSPCLIALHERRAAQWAAQHAVSAEALDRALAAGLTEIPALAERFCVTEDLMRRALCWHTHGSLEPASLR